MAAEKNVEGASAEAVEQRDAQLRFEGANVLGDRRLREEKRPGSARKGAVVGDRLEDAQSSQIHKSSLTN